MKWLVALLLLANLAYFGWQSELRRTAPAQVAVVEVAQPPGEHLLLLSERPPVPMPPSATPDPDEGREEPREAEAEPPRAAAPTQESSEPSLLPAPTEEHPPVPEPAHTEAPKCFRIAGFAQATDAETYSASLKKAGAAVISRGSTKESVTSYRVVLPPTSPAMVKRSVERLERARIKDFYVIRSGEDANAISLGVFSTRTAAERRIAEIAALRPSPGRARIESTDLESQRFWLLLLWKEGPPTGWAKVPAQGVTFTPAACP